MQPIRITSLLEYEQLFGSAQKEVAITVTISDTNSGGVSARSISADNTAAGSSRFKMYYAMQMFFAIGLMESQ